MTSMLTRPAQILIHNMSNSVLFCSLARIYIKHATRFPISHSQPITRPVSINLDSFRSMVPVFLAKLDVRHATHELNASTATCSCPPETYLTTAYSGGLL